MYCLVVSAKLFMSKFGNKFTVTALKLVLLALYAALILPVIMILTYFVLSGQILTPDIILAIFQTNYAEAIAYLQTQNTANLVSAALSLFVIIAGCFLPLCKFVNSKITCRANILFTLFLLAASCVSVNEFCRSNHPFKIISSAQQVLRSYNEYNENKNVRKTRLASLSGLKINEKRGGVHVLIIGESATRDHMHVYGYARDNTPFLDSIKNDENVFIFPHSYSCHGYTVRCLTYALSQKNQYNTIELRDAYSIVEAAKAAGYSTYWISNQEKLWGTPVAAIASAADKEIWINNNAGLNSEALYYDEILADAIDENAGSKNALIVLHLAGSHFRYWDRYPGEYAKYSDNKYNRSTVDEYDDSILYTDHVIEKILDKVKNMPGFKTLTYFSDHGEDPDKNLGHEITKFTWSMTRIPLMIYCSPAYISENPDIFNNLRKNKEKYWTNDLLFDLLAGMMGIDGDLRLPKKFDISSEQYDMPVEDLRTVHGTIQIAGDRS